MHACIFRGLILAVSTVLSASESTNVGVYKSDTYTEIRPLEDFKVWSPRHQLGKEGVVVDGDIASIFDEDIIFMEFRAFGHEFQYNLTKNHYIPTIRKVEEQDMIIVDDNNSNNDPNNDNLSNKRQRNGKVQSYCTYSSDLRQTERIVATLLRDGTIHAVLHKDGHDYQIDRVSSHQDFMQDELYTALEEEANALTLSAIRTGKPREGHTIVKVLHNLKLRQGSCGVGGESKYSTVPAKGKKENYDRTAIAMSNYSSPHFYFNSHLYDASEEHNHHDHKHEQEHEHEHKHEHEHHQHDTMVHVRRMLAVERWTDCFPNDAVTRFLQIGIVVDYGAYKNFGSSEARVQETMATLINDCNFVYARQLNIMLKIGEIIIVKTTSRTDTILGSGKWNQDPDGSLGCHSIDTALDHFSTWRNSFTEGKYGLWHHITNCHAPPGTVGLAWKGVIGTLVNNYWSSTGVSHFSSRSDWGTVAHEIGHNFNADHSFEEGQGGDISVIF